MVNERKRNDRNAVITRTPVNLSAYPGDSHFKVYLGNLPPGTDDAQLRAWLSDRISTFKKKTNSETGESFRIKNEPVF